VTVEHATLTAVIHPAVLKLQQGTEALHKIAAERPVLVAQALLAGQRPQDVADALGWDVIELRTEVGRWATLLLAEGRLSDANYTDLMCTVFGPA
jgi:hypothetical protein